MAAGAGRDMRIKYDSGAGAAVIAGARTDSLTINNQRIEVGDKDDNGVPVALDDVAIKEFSASCTGVLKNSTLITLADSAGTGTAVHDFEIEIGASGAIRTYSGPFFIDSFQTDGEDADAIQFTMAISGAGAITAS